MKMAPRCIECLISRVAFECRLCIKDESRIRAIAEECRALLHASHAQESAAPVIASCVHARAYELLGCPDPYLALKQQSNEQARAVCRSVSPTLKTFRDFVLASVIANTFDYGVQSHQVTDDFLRYFHERYRQGLFIDDSERMHHLAASGGHVVYFTDNAGEIVFDALLIRHLRSLGAEVTLAVKGAPILNDATLQDALEFGLDRIATHLTTTGSGRIGIDLDSAPPDLLDSIGRATLIIAKGMANYESLTEYEGLPPIAYCMAVKCETIAENVGAPLGSMVAMLDTAP